MRINSKATTSSQLSSRMQLRQSDISNADTTEDDHDSNDDTPNEDVVRVTQVRTNVNPGSETDHESTVFNPTELLQ